MNELVLRMLWTRWPQWDSKSKIPLAMANRKVWDPINRTIEHFRSTNWNKSNRFCSLNYLWSESWVRTWPPPKTSEPSFPRSLSGTQAAIRTVKAGNDGPAPSPINIRNIIRQISAYSSPETNTHSHVMLESSIHHVQHTIFKSLWCYYIANRYYQYTKWERPFSTEFFRQQTTRNMGK